MLSRRFVHPAISVVIPAYDAEEYLQRAVRSVQGQTRRAAEVVRQVEPRVVVPMHYALPALKTDLAPVERFLKEMGVTEAEPQPRLSVQASSTEAETRVVVLEPRV